MDRVYYKEIAPDYYVTIIDGVKIELGNEDKHFPNDDSVRFKEMTIEIPFRTIRIRYVDIALDNFIGLIFKDVIPPLGIVKTDGTIIQMKDGSTSKYPHEKSVCDFLNSLNLGYEFETRIRPSFHDDEWCIWYVSTDTEPTGVWCWHQPHKTFFKKYHFPNKIGKRLTLPKDGITIINKEKEPVIVISEYIRGDTIIGQVCQQTIFVGANSYYAIYIKDAITFLTSIEPEAHYMLKYIAKRLMIGICKYYIHISKEAHIQKTDWKNLLIRIQKGHRQLDYDEKEEISNILINSLLTESKKLLKTKHYGKRSSKCEGITTHTSESEVA